MYKEGVETTRVVQSRRVINEDDTFERASTTGNIHFIEEILMPNTENRQC